MRTTRRAALWFLAAPALARAAMPGPFALGAAVPVWGHRPPPGAPAPRP